MPYAILAAVVLLLAAAIIIKPMRKMLKVALNCAAGVIALLIVSLLGGYIGVLLAVNGYTLATAAVLGLPGIALLLLLKLIFQT